MCSLPTLMKPDFFCLFCLSWECHRNAELGSPTAARILLALLRLEELTAPARPNYETVSKAGWLP